MGCPRSEVGGTPLGNETLLGNGIIRNIAEKFDL